jgi:hypothetical protein
VVEPVVETVVEPVVEDPVEIVHETDSRYIEEEIVVFGKKRKIRKLRH